MGQEHITQTLHNALQNGRVSHAYLLTGPRGVGKTSIARILAHEINGIPYSEDAHLDIIEIDAASNRRIDEIRDLRDHVHSAPNSARYKVYIIDEVHMLTKEAFNALLKTLEEPPEHVVFILATTEAHKLPETIVSRTQRYSFRPVPLEQVSAHLRNISHSEKIQVDDDALTLIAEHGEGSFRDSISLLDQASSVSEIVTKAEVEKLLGRAPEEHIEGIIAACVAGDRLRALQNLHALYDQGYEAAMLAIQLGTHLRANLSDMTQPGLPETETFSMLRQLLDVPPAHSSKQLLEIIVLQTCHRQQPTTSHANHPPQSTSTTTTVQSQPRAPEPTAPRTIPQAAETVAAKNTDTPARASVEPIAVSEPSLAADLPNHTETDKPLQPIESTEKTIEVVWQEALQSIKKSHNTLYGIARMARPHLEGDTLTLELHFSFHQKRLNEPRNKAILTAVVENIRGQGTTIQCIATPKDSTPRTLNNDVATISNIFGGAELL